MSPDQSADPARGTHGARRTDRPAEVGSDLPPSCRYVLYVLEREGELSRQELLERTGLPAQTVDWALETLTEGDFLLKSRDPMDLRQVVYEVRGGRQRDG